MGVSSKTKVSDSSYQSKKQSQRRQSSPGSRKTIKTSAGEVRRVSIREAEVEVRSGRATYVPKKVWKESRKK